jgi:hypothetical protein
MDRPFLSIVSAHGCRSRPCCPQLAFAVALELNRLVKTPAAATRVVSPCDDRETWRHSVGISASPSC